MSDAEFLNENKPILDTQTLEALKLAATFKAVGEACINLNTPPETPVSRANETAPFSVLLQGYYSPYNEKYLEDHRKAEREFLKSFGYSGMASYYARALVHDEGNFFSSLYVLPVDGLVVRQVNSKHEPNFRATAVTVTQPDRLKAVAAYGKNPYDQISMRAAVDLLLWYGRGGNIDSPAQSE
jgi:hypothetical protein